MATAFQSDAFQNDAFQIEAVAVEPDTHDGGRNVRRVYDEEDIFEEVEQRAARYRRSKDKLRADIILAIDGPQEDEVLEIVGASLGDERAALAAPDYEPTLRGLLAQMSALRRIAEIAIAEEKRRIDEDEADVELLLLQ